MDRVFLDANVLFSAAFKPTSTIRALWSLAGTELISSPFAIQEAHSNLAQTKPAQLADLAALLTAVRIVPDPPPNAMLPPGITLPDKDAPIFLSVVDSSATHLPTGDVKHFGPYFGITVAGVLILRPGVYLLSRQSTP